MDVFIFAPIFFTTTGVIWSFGPSLYESFRERVRAEVERELLNPSQEDREEVYDDLEEIMRMQSFEKLKEDVYNLREQRISTASLPQRPPPLEPVSFEPSWWNVSGVPRWLRDEPKKKKKYPKKKS